MRCLKKNIAFLVLYLKIVISLRIFASFRLITRYFHLLEKYENHMFFLVQKIIYENGTTLYKQTSNAHYLII